MPSLSLIPGELNYNQERIYTTVRAMKHTLKTPEEIAEKVIVEITGPEIIKMVDDVIAVYEDFIEDVDVIIWSLLMKRKSCVTTARGMLS